MANRNDELYALYLTAYIYSGGRCSDLQEGRPKPQNMIYLRGNDAKVVVALGQRHGVTGAELMSMDRLVATVGEMVGVDPLKTGDLSAAKAAMKDLADAGQSAKPDSCEVFVINMSVAVPPDAKAPNAGDLAAMKAGTQGLGVVTEKVVEVVSTAGGGVVEQTTSFPRGTFDPPNMGDVWEPRLGGPPITLLFHDPTCGVKGMWRTGYGDQDCITTDSLMELYERKYALKEGICCSWVTAVATWAAVRAGVKYPARVGDLVFVALGPNAKMSEIKAAVAALALAEKSAASAK